MPKAESYYMRDLAMRYLVGRGVDVACGEEKVIPNAIGVDFPHQNAIPEHPKTAADVLGAWLDVCEAFIPAQLDYVFTSHLLEDYEDMDLLPYLHTMLAALRPGGIFMVYQPIDEEYRKHCVETNQVYNNAHRQKWTGPDDFMRTFARLTRGVAVDVVEQNIGPGPYSFYVVMRKG
jgi:predicted SAM-dependent methyltransferase